MTYSTTCRFCHLASYETPNRGMVRYAVRHWSHWDCAIGRFGFEPFINKLSAFQLEKMPWTVCMTNDRKSLVRARIAHFAAAVKGRA